MGLEVTVWAEFGYRAVNAVFVRVEGLRVAGSKLSEGSPCALERTPEPEKISQTSQRNTHK